MKTKDKNYNVRGTVTLTFIVDYDQEGQDEDHAISRVVWNCCEGDYDAITHDLILTEVKPDGVG